jgi:hypothetical protein
MGRPQGPAAIDARLRDIERKLDMLLAQRAAADAPKRLEPRASRAGRASRDNTAERRPGGRVKATAVDNQAQEAGVRRRVQADLAQADRVASAELTALVI